jgi:ABC-type uncharacterized transport system permease subunit
MTIDILANPAFWVAVMRIATPLIFGTLGVLLCERCGVLNLGIEGIMVAGAFTGWLSVYLRRTAVGGRGGGGAHRRGAGFAARRTHRGAGAVAARLGSGHHAAGHGIELLRLPGEFPQGVHTPHDHAVCADGLAGHSGSGAADTADTAGPACGAR